ncbi:LTA synthase family protein [Leptospira ilyithenensis]|uniref:Alkaline phosphatase family protein n=1 Tax=Leptospira ilyithenensis TaxID=2484901 RepID=A0A4R9LL40_9LEPT|nr:alkaline phosphatase family protein [Leptospira ilyithenensis]TGN06864.1 alkaline phosphatase family protein [Leptospira ilyithenensis]
MKLLYRNLSFSDKLFLGYSLSFLSLFTIFRIIFLFAYSYRLESFQLSVILHAFAVGLRFDLATTGMLLGAFYILSKLSILNRFRSYRILWSFPPILIFAWSIAHLSGDMLYYENANKHIGYEAIVFLADMPILIRSAIHESPIVMILIISGIIGFLLVSFYGYQKWILPQGNEPFSFYKFFISLSLAFFLTIILTRGGVQETPLRASNAIFSEDTFVNNIPLNGIYTTIMDLKSQSIPKELKMDLSESYALVRNEIDYPEAEFVNLPNYPLLRKQLETNKSKPPNIVLILQESWTGKFVWPIGDGIIHGKELTPFYNKLAKEGHSFKRFFANGGRTSNGLLSMLTGIPDRPGLTAVRTHQVLGNFSGLGNVFKRWGYDTIFITGDDLQFDSLGTILPHWGFQKIIGKKEIEKKHRFKIGAWGYDDRDILEVLHDEISISNKNGKPFLGTILTMTTHYPYKVPDSKFEIYDPSVQDYDYLNTYHYADWALSDFISRAEKSDYFKNTIFVFVADHTHHRYLNYLEDRNVPFLIWAPGKIKAKLDTRTASQLDVLPTILGLVGKETYFSAMGKNLLSSGKTKESAYFAYGVAFGWIEENQFLVQWVDGNKNFTLTANPPLGDNEKCKQTPILCSTSLQKAKAYFNLSIELMNKNKVFPGGML